MKIKQRSTTPLARKARCGFRGFPVATIAFYGPDNTRANKVDMLRVSEGSLSEKQLARWLHQHTMAE